MRGIKLEIILGEDGRLTVNGGIMSNKIMALGMLAAATKAVHDYDPEKDPGILLAEPGLPNGLVR